MWSWLEPFFAFPTCLVWLFLSWVVKELFLLFVRSFSESCSVGCCNFGVCGGDELGILLFCYLDPPILFLFFIPLFWANLYCFELILFVWIWEVNCQIIDVEQRKHLGSEMLHIYEINSLKEKQSEENCIFDVLFCKCINFTNFDNFSSVCIFSSEVVSHLLT